VLERAIPKNRGAEFLDLIEELANDTCVEGDPHCSRCELRRQCAFVLTRRSSPPESAPAARSTSATKPMTATRTPKGKTAAKTGPNQARKRPAKKAVKEPPRSSRSARGRRGRK